MAVVFIRTIVVFFTTFVVVTGILCLTWMGDILRMFGPAVLIGALWGAAATLVVEMVVGLFTAAGPRE